MTMTAYEFEEAVWELDRIRIVIRADWNDEVEDYNYDYADGERRTLTDFLRTRVRPRINGLSVGAIDGSGTWVNGGRQLRNIRNTYQAR